MPFVLTAINTSLSSLSTLYVASTYITHVSALGTLPALTRIYMNDMKDGLVDITSLSEVSTLQAIIRGESTVCLDGNRSYSAAFLNMVGDYIDCP